MVCFTDTNDEAAVGVGPFRYLLVAACHRPERPSLTFGKWPQFALQFNLTSAFSRIETPEHKGGTWR